MRDGYFHWGRRTLPTKESQWLEQRFWQGARHRFLRSMFQTPTRDTRHAQQWVRQVHAWYQTTMSQWVR